MLTLKGMTPEETCEVIVEETLDRARDLQMECLVITEQYKGFYADFSDYLFKSAIEVYNKRCDYIEDAEYSFLEFMNLCYEKFKNNGSNMWKLNPKNSKSEITAYVDVEQHDQMLDVCIFVEYVDELVTMNVPKLFMSFIRVENGITDYDVIVHLFTVTGEEKYMYKYIDAHSHIKGDDTETPWYKKIGEENKLYEQIMELIIERMVAEGV